jgi:uncharacterized DUF497 family protein
MKNLIFRWSEEKNKILKESRGISFEEIVTALQEGCMLEDIPNPSKNHKNQGCFVINFKGYTYIVPYIEDEDGAFLKTIYPSRKYKKLLLNK